MTVKDQRCPLCRELADFLPRAGSGRLVAILPDLNPVTPGHVMAVPVRHVSRVEDLKKAEWNALGELVRQTMKDLRCSSVIDGVNVGINSGSAAGQTIEHAHVHIIPRRTGDCEDPRGGVRWIMPERAPYWNTHDGSGP